MSTTVKAGWLKDNQGNKFAPKTMSSQVINDDGILLEEKINLDLNELRESTNEELAKKADKEHSHEEYITQQYVDENLALKSDLENINLSAYYTKTEIDNYEFVTVEDIDAICGTNIQMASEVMF